MDDLHDLPTSHLIAERDKLFGRLRATGLSPVEKTELQSAYIAVCSTIGDREDALQQAIVDERLAVEAAMDERAAMIRQRIADVEAAAELEGKNR